MSKFIEKYKNSNKQKFIEAPLPVQPVIYPDKISEPVRISPMTIEMEMRYYQTIRSLADKQFPIEFLMFDDVLEDIVFSSNPKKPLEYEYLTSQDIQFIAYNMRMQTYGETIKPKINCPTCFQFYNEYNELVKTPNSQQQVKDLIKKYKIKNFNEQEILLGPEFYNKIVEIPLTNYTIEFPNKFSDVVLEYKTFSTVPIKLTLPRVGWYTEIKKYLLDFRQVLQTYLPEYLDSSEEEIDQLSELYKNYQTMQLSIYSIGDDIVEIEDVQEIPLVLRNIINSSDVENIMEILRSFSKYRLSIDYEFKCDRCGHKEVIDATSFPFEYIFGVKN